MEKYLSRIILFVSILCLLFFPLKTGWGTIGIGIAKAADAVLEWDANTEPQLAGYNIFQAERVGDHTTAWSLIGSVEKEATTYTIPDIDMTKNWAWLVTAFDDKGNESRVSNMVELVDKTPPMPPPNLRKAVIQ